VSQQSILTGGIDTGIDSGKFVIDTSNNIGVNSSNHDLFAERFIGPYARNQLNSNSWLENNDSQEEGQSSQRSSQLMQ